MGEKIKNFITRPWVSGIMALLTLFSVCWAIYEHFYVPNPKVQFEVVSAAQLFNNTDRVSSLHVFVDSLDIRDAKQNVTLYTIRISNRGRKHVGTADYEGESFGIQVESGVILDDNDLLYASNVYLEQAFEQFIPEGSDTFLDLPQLALDINDYYEFSVAILHESGVAPELIPVGKILGQKTLGNIQPSSKDKLPFFEQVFYGDVWAHLFRVFIGIFIVFVFALLGAIGTIGSEAASEKKRTLKFLNDVTTSKRILGFIKEDVLNNGVESVVFAHEQMEAGIEEMAQNYKEAQEYIEIDEHLLSRDYETYRREYAGCISLFNKGYLKKNEYGKMVVPVGVKESVDLIYGLMQKYHLHEFAIKRNLPEA